MEAAQARLATHVAPEGGAEYAPRSIPVMTKEKGPRAAKRLREEGNDAYRSQRYNEAIKWYTAALAADESAAPLERAKVHCNLSACYKEMGDWQTASKEAARAIDAAPDFVKGHVRLGLATIDSQPQKAADAFQQVPGSTRERGVREVPRRGASEPGKVRESRRERDVRGRGAGARHRLQDGPGLAHVAARRPRRADRHAREGGGARGQPVSEVAPRVGRAGTTACGSRSSTWRRGRS